MPRASETLSRAPEKWNVLKKLTGKLEGKKNRG